MDSPISSRLESLFSTIVTLSQVVVVIVVVVVAKEGGSQWRRFRRSRYLDSAAGRITKKKGQQDQNQFFLTTIKAWICQQNLCLSLYTCSFIDVHDEVSLGYSLIFVFTEQNKKYKDIMFFKPLFHFMKNIQDLHAFYSLSTISTVPILLFGFEKTVLVLRQFMY